MKKCPICQDKFTLGHAAECMLRIRDRIEIKNKCANVEHLQKFERNFAELARFAIKENKRMKPKDKRSLHTFPYSCDTCKRSIKCGIVIDNHDYPIDLS